MLALFGCLSVQANVVSHKTRASSDSLIAQLRQAKSVQEARDVIHAIIPETSREWRPWEEPATSGQRRLARLIMAWSPSQISSLPRHSGDALLYELGLLQEHIAHFYENLSPPRLWRFDTRALVDSVMLSSVLFIIGYHILKIYQLPFGLGTRSLAIMLAPFAAGVGVWVGRPWKFVRYSRADREKQAERETGKKNSRNIDPLYLRALIDVCAK